MKFVGRRQEIATIRQQIIEIPNQDGIIFGLGGIGKTALIIQICRELFEEANIDNVLFDNIVWVLAKRTLYNPRRDSVEKKEQQVENLDQIISAILDFFEFEDLDGYSFDDKKALLLELLEEKRVLLVLDNCETFNENEAQKIVDFFGIEVKYHLRKLPLNFKVILTSRVRIPSGFHQVHLKGLDLRESKQLMTSLYKPYEAANPELSDEQKGLLHAATFGIPIIIKHCFGQLYEFNVPFDQVCSSLASDENKAVAFSFAEIFKMLKRDKLQLEIVLLLELISCPLMIRQISDILDKDEALVTRKMPLLVNFQCIRKVNQGRDEKYSVNDDIRVITKQLMQGNAEMAQAIRQKITANFTLEKQMDYSSEERSILDIFNTLLSQQQVLEAESFVIKVLEEKPDSVLLRYHYAKYLKEEKRDIEAAIHLLEEIREPSNNHPSILRILVACYLCLDVPNFEHASTYVTQLESVASDNALRFEIGDFYVRWSISTKMNRDINPDPIEEMLRQQSYKELADRALGILNQIQDKTHEVYYRLAQCYFNKWDRVDALRMIDKALDLANGDLRYQTNYSYLRKLILSKKNID